MSSAKKSVMLRGTSHEVAGHLSDLARQDDAPLVTCSPKMHSALKLLELSYGHHVKLNGIVLV